MAKNTSRSRLNEFLTIIEDDLNRTMTFWQKHSHDEDYGGFFNCLSHDGRIYDTVKYGWLQGRQVWMYARLYNQLERFHNDSILQASLKGGEFIKKYLKDDQSSQCYFLVTQDGKPIKMQRTLFCECFYLMAMSELYIASKNIDFKTEAINMFKKIQYWILTDDSALGRVKLEGCPAQSALGVPMMSLCIIDQLLTMDEGLQNMVDELLNWAINRILSHVQRNGSIVLENVSDDGKELPGSQGRLTVPGHVIECGWFLLKIASRTNNADLVNLATKSFILKSYTEGWDKEFGGLFYFLDVDGWCPTQLEWNMKLWWPHNEAMIAFLMAYKETRDLVFLNKFEEVFDYVYAKFVDRANGEWYGYLNRSGQVSLDFKGGPFKGCFHVPRSLMICEQLLKEIINDGL